jgi:DNA polymerase III delta subunit
VTIDSEQLPRQLERGLAPLYTVFGDEPLLAIEAADRIRAAARARSPRSASSSCASRRVRPASKAPRRS